MNASDADVDPEKSIFRARYGRAEAIARNAKGANETSVMLSLFVEYRRFAACSHARRLQPEKVWTDAGQH